MGLGLQCNAHDEVSFCWTGVAVFGLGGVNDRNLQPDEKRSSDRVATSFIHTCHPTGANQPD